MGCLNSQGQFDHWFANIHFSGPCNRACYFCIGQHMPGVDPINNLDTWPLPGLDRFVQECKRAEVREVNLTGSDTDPLLYQHLPQLCAYLRDALPGIRLGIRTNGILVKHRGQPHSAWPLFDKASISITSFDGDLYRKTMGRGTPPDLAEILNQSEGLDIKVNVVLCPETVESGDLWKTLTILAGYGVKRVNLREPYGQPRIGDPLADRLPKWGEIFGMPQYQIGDTVITYWDVHYVEVESVNLYANGLVSTTYPVSLGHDPTVGKVLDQTNFKASGRQASQWNFKNTGRKHHLAVI